MTITFLDDHVSIIHVDVPIPAAATGQPAVRLIDTEPKITAGDRSVSHTWLISEGTNDSGRPVRTLAVLTTMHVNSRSKGFLTTLNVVTETDEEMHGRTFTTQGYMPFDAIRIGFEPVARYSAKALSIAGAQARAALMARKDDDAVRKVFGEVEDSLAVAP